MPDPDATLLARADRQSPDDPDVRRCWRLVIAGIRIGWLDRDDVREVIVALRLHEHRGFDELLFEEVGETLRVSFLDYRCECSPAAMIAELEALLA